MRGNCGDRRPDSSARSRLGSYNCANSETRGDTSRTLSEIHTREVPGSIQVRASKYPSVFSPQACSLSNPCPMFFRNSVLRVRNGVERVRRGEQTGERGSNTLQIAVFSAVSKTVAGGSVGRGFKSLPLRSTKRGAARRRSASTGCGGCYDRWLNPLKSTSVHGRPLFSSGAGERVANQTRGIRLPLGNKRAWGTEPSTTTTHSPRSVPPTGDP